MLILPVTDQEFAANSGAAPNVLPTKAGHGISSETAEFRSG